ncbi:cytochrome P450 [Salipiger sp. IMCC34102]|uniref:cytochrome P450 n=1 Tax=Salipiger sp. IMCC34102 TaxID=2510647 RepID=UPI00101DCAE4|nr:cytochrome P450 [Salipiger sp. IMCC34102]RYH02636.1 cytochrome P450 [Salipiger sp. IMCC34102]
MTFPETITIEELDRDPFPIYARLREEFPVAYVPAANVWFVTRWDDVQTVTKSPDLFTADADASPVDRAFGRPNILSAEGPTHKALRGGLEPHYRPKKVADFIDALVTPIARDYLSKIQAKGQAELMSEYFEPISTLALARSLGIEDIDAETLRRWFHGMSAGATNFENDPAKTALNDAVATEIEAVVAPLLARLRTQPDTTALSQMLHHDMPEGETRPDDFILPTLKVTLLGGMQEPGHGAGTTLVGLLQNPDQMAQVMADPEALIPRAVTEGIRWVAPIATQFRIPLEDTELGGVTLPKGAPVTAVLASANRDESRFDDPDRFDINRAAAGAATFGFGHHFCAGRWFAAAQIEIALRVLLDALTDIRLDGDDAVVFNGWEFRAPRKLNVRFTPKG